VRGRRLRGVEANCSAVLLIGDVAAATAAFDARK
jgi:hypothetical protein